MENFSKELKSLKTKEMLYQNQKTKLIFQQSP